MKDTAARKALILKLMNGWPSQAASFTSESLDTYVEATGKCTLDALGRSVTQFISGKVARSNAFVPSAAELAANATEWDEAIATVTANKALDRIVAYPIGGKPPPPAVPLGPLSVDFGSGKIDMSKMTPAEKEKLLRGEWDKEAPNGLPRGGEAKKLPKPKLRKPGDPE